MLPWGPRRSSELSSARFLAYRNWELTRASVQVSELRSHGLKQKTRPQLTSLSESLLSPHLENRWNMQCLYLLLVPAPKTQFKPPPGGSLPGLPAPSGRVRVPRGQGQDRTWHITGVWRTEVAGWREGSRGHWPSVKFPLSLANCGVGARVSLDCGSLRVPACSQPWSFP